MLVVLETWQRDIKHQYVRTFKERFSIHINIATVLTFSCIKVVYLDYLLLIIVTRCVDISGQRGNSGQLQNGHVILDVQYAHRAAGVTDGLFISGPLEPALRGDISVSLVRDIGVSLELA